MTEEFKALCPICGEDGTDFLTAEQLADVASGKGSAMCMDCYGRLCLQRPDVVAGKETIVAGEQGVPMGLSKETAYAIAGSEEAGNVAVAALQKVREVVIRLMKETGTACVLHVPKHMVRPTMELLMHYAAVACRPDILARVSVEAKP
jgi:hypothetical protein